MRRAHLLVGVTAAAGSLLLATPSVAGQPAGPSSETIAEGLSSPYQVKAFPGGAMVPQNPEGAAARVSAFLDDGSQTDLVYDDGFISGIALADGEIAYTLAAGSEEQPVTRLKVRQVNMRAIGRPARGLEPPSGENLANLGRFEQRVNPDSVNRYGIRGVKNCEGVPEEGRPYNGTPFSNPYAVEAASEGGWFVADAGANSLLHVSDDGAIEVVAVLPPQREVITEATAEQAELPRCTIGKVGKFEPVPTDVEESASGQLFVTLLPGGPSESNGKLVRINRDTGKVTVMARKFVGATNLALAPGRIFVNQLFGGKISVIDRDTWQKERYIGAQLPAASDYGNGGLYATTEIFGPAKLVKITENIIN